MWNQLESAPAHNSIRYALQGLDSDNVEKSFRDHSLHLQEETSEHGSALASETNLVLGHIWITDDDGDKQHEIQAVQELIKGLGVAGQLFTLDALHTQKNS